MANSPGRAHSLQLGRVGCGWPERLRRKSRDGARWAGTLRKEEVEKAQARAVFNEVAAGLDADQTEQFRVLVEDMDFRGAGDGPRLRAALTEIRNRAFIDEQVESVSRRNFEDHPEELKIGKPGSCGKV